MLEKNVQAQIGFGYLGQLDDDQSKDFAEIEKNTCKMYGKKNLKKIDDVRTEVFMEKYKPKKDRDKISCAKNFDTSITKWDEQSLFQTFGCHPLKLHHSILGGNWSTETNYLLLWVWKWPITKLNWYYIGWEKHDGKYYMFLFCFVLLDVLCLVDTLCYLEMTEKSKECAKMLNEVDWGIRDDDGDDFRSDSGKE